MALKTQGDLVVDGDIAAGDVTSEPLDCRDRANCRFQLSANALNTPNGTFQFYGSDDPRVPQDLAESTDTAQWTLLTLPLGCAHGENFTAPAEGDTSIAWDGAAALNLAVNLDAPFEFMRVVYVDGTGGDGAGSLLQVRGTARR